MTLLYARRRVWHACRLSLLSLFAVAASAAATAQVSLPITFEESVDYQLFDFGGDASTVVEDPADNTNHVLKIVRVENAQTYAGTAIGNGGFTQPIPFAPDQTTLSIRVWTPAAGTPILLKVESTSGADPVEVQRLSTVSGGYETLVFDFADPSQGALDFSKSYDRVVVFPNFGAAGAPEATYYVDDIAFGNGPGRLLINEVDSDTPGSDTAEFVELYNPGDSEVSLDGHVVVFFNAGGSGTNDVSYAAFDLTGTLAPGAYYVLGNPGVPNVNQTFDPGSTGFLQNGADAVALYMGAATDFPNGTNATTTNLIDAIVYDTNDSDAGLLLSGLGKTTQYNEDENGNKDNESIQRVPDGSSMIVTAVATPGAMNMANPVPTAFTALLRSENEVPSTMSMAKGGVTATLTGTMLTVTGTFADLEGAFAAAHLHGGAPGETGDPVVTLVATTTDDMLGGSFDAASNTFPVRETFADSIRAGLVYVNVHSAVYDSGEIRGQLGTDTDVLPFYLSGEQEVPPVTTDAMGDGTVSVQGAMVTVSGTFSGLVGDYQASHIHEGAMAESGDVVQALTVTLNDDQRGGTFDAGATFMVRETFADSIRAGLAYINVHSAAFGGGEIRGQIGFPSPAPPVMSIADVRAAGMGQSVTVEGIVTRSMGRTTYLQDGDAALVVYQQSGPLFDAIANGDVAEGDSLRVTGTTKEYNGLFEIDPVEAFMVISRDNDLPEPQYVTLAEIAANGEDYEAELLYVLDLMIADDGDQTFDAGSGSGKTYAITDPSDDTGAVSLRVPRDSDTEIEGVAIPDGPALFIGVLGQFDSSDPRDSGYQLSPVDIDDVMPMPEPMTVAEARAEGVGEEVYFQATVTRSMGAFTYLQDDTAGLTIRQTSGAFADSVASGAIAPGTVLRVIGTLSEYRQLLQINQANATTNDLANFTIMGTDDVPDAQLVTLAQIASNGEDYEAELVTVDGLSITGTGDFAAASTYAISDDSDASGTVTLRIPNADDTSADGTPIPSKARVTAIVGQFNSSDPAAGYQLLVLEAGDVQSIVANEDGSVAVNRLSVANPIRGATTVEFSLAAPGKATVAVFDMLGRRVATLAEGDVDTSVRTVTLDAGTMASGVYVLRLTGEDVMLSRTVTVVR